MAKDVVGDFAERPFHSPERVWPHSAPPRNEPKNLVQEFVGLLVIIESPRRNVVIGIGCRVKSVRLNEVAPVGVDEKAI